MTRAIVNADVLIIGGGLHGGSVALHLAHAGLKPLVIEKNYAGRHASGVNAGGVRTLSRPPQEIPLALASLEMWHHIGDLVDDDCGFEQYGQLRVAENETDVEVLHRRLALMRELGYSHEEWVDAGEVRAMLPGIVPTVQGGLIARRDAAADPYRTTMAFRRKAESLGARYIEGVQIVRTEHVAGCWRAIANSGAVYSAPVIVNCAGAWADRIAATWDEPVPLEAVAPMMLVTMPMRRFIDPVVLGASRPLSFKQRANGTVLIGGGRRAWLDRDADSTELDFNELADGARMVCELFPHMLGATINRGWAGIEGNMPDGLPVIGASRRRPHAYHAFGFCTHGFELGPIVGRVLADLVIRGHTTQPIAPFDIGRFSNPQAVTSTSGIKHP